MQPDEFLKIFAYLRAAYPRQVIDEMTPDVFMDILGDLPADLLKLACRKWVSESQWFPSASELRNAVFAMMEPALGLPDVGEAWKEAMGRLNIANPAPEEEWSHPAVYRAWVGIGGDQVVGWSKPDSLMSHRARFQDLYKEYTRREKQDLRMLPSVRAAAAQLAGGSGLRLTDGKGE